MTPKTLEEFIKEKARPMYQALEAGTGTQLTGSFALEAIAEATAAEILRVAHDCSFDAYTNEGQKIRVVMLEDLESYIQPAKKESERL